MPNETHPSDVSNNSNQEWVFTPLELAKEQAEDYFGISFANTPLSSSDIQLLLNWYKHTPLLTSGKKYNSLLYTLSSAKANSLPQLVINTRYDSETTQSIQKLFEVFCTFFTDAFKKSREKDTTKILDVISTFVRMNSPNWYLDSGTISNLALSIQERMPSSPHERFPSLITFIQALQILSLRSTKTPSIFDNREEVAISISSTDDLKDMQLWKRLASPEEIFTRILALSAPYRCSLGDSSIGRNNLQELITTLENLNTQTSLLESSPELQKLARFSIEMQLFHCTGEINDEELQRLPPNLQQDLISYIAFRKQQPLWKDRVQFLKNHSSQYGHQEQKSIPSQFRIAVSTSLFSAFKILESGKYKSFHEIFTSNGMTLYSHRVGVENKMNILATGTPDDPYVVYGAPIKLNSRKFNVITELYGNICFLVQPSAYERITTTPSDSFDAYKLPLYGINNVDLFVNADEPISESSYIEVQIHGERDISELFDTVVIFEELEVGLLQHLKKVCKERGLQLIQMADLQERTEQNKTENLGSRIKHIFKGIT